jgi:hypothetical protein
MMKGSRSFGGKLTQERMIKITQLKKNKVGCHTEYLLI